MLQIIHSFQPGRGRENIDEEIGSDSSGNTAALHAGEDTCDECDGFTLYLIFRMIRVLINNKWIKSINFAGLSQHHLPKLTYLTRLSLLQSIVE
jgi:hypothetical protein